MGFFIKEEYEKAGRGSFVGDESRFKKFNSEM